uniref:GNAT family N-acetyltransferase n=1 Tax=Acetatifactor sp. TaxID=1872090 RepID=UPI004056BA03
MNHYQIEIRKETENDYHATEEVCLRAFWNLHGPGCDEHLLVRKLRTHKDYLPEISRIATVDGKVAATIMYSKATIRDGECEYPVITFGPLAVDPMYQNTGVGGKLLKYTMELAKEAGYSGIVIFGEPKYYPKHGFVTADHFGFTDAGGNNFDAFMAFELQEGAFANKKGKFHESEVFETLTQEKAEELCKEFKPLLKGNFPCQWTYSNASREKDGYYLEPAQHYLKDSRRLFNAYIEELSRFNSRLATQRDENGNYLNEVYMEYLTTVEKHPYVIFVEDQAIGFAVMSAASADEQEDGCISYMEEIFVEKEFRGKGIATDIVKRFMEQQEGTCGFGKSHIIERKCPKAGYTAGCF